MREAICIHFLNLKQIDKCDKFLDIKICMNVQLLFKQHVSLDLKLILNGFLCLIPASIN